MVKTFLAVLCSFAVAGAADLSGPWELTMTGGENVMYSRLNLEMKDGKYAGSFQGVDVTGTVNGSDITFEGVERGKPIGSLSGTITEAGMSGSGTLDGIPMQ